MPNNAVSSTSNAAANKQETPQRTGTIESAQHTSSCTSCGEVIPPPEIPDGQRYVATLALSALAVPYVVGLITFTAYGITVTVNGILLNAFLLGVILSLLLWLVLSWVTKRNRFAAADGANPGSYAELTRKLQYLQGKHVANSSRSVRALLDLCTKALQSTGSQWLWGSGYINMWRMLHRVEEDLICTQATDCVIAGALVDRLRLQGSEIANRDELTRDLNRATITLRPSMAPYFADIPVTTRPDVDTVAVESESGCPRAVLWMVRQAINEYRDDQRNGVLQVRNRIFKTTMVVEVVALLLLGLAVAAGAPQPQLWAAGAFFLVGAIVGLLATRLRTDVEAASTTDEDYGLSTARLWATPLYSGMVAIGGVVFTAVTVTVAQDGLPDLLAGDVAPLLTDVFEIGTLNLIVAAFFGLSPAYFFDRLRGADKLLDNLKSTKPANQTSP